MIKDFNPEKFWHDLDHYTELYWPVIVLDFNGVLDQYKGWNGELQDYPPAEGVKEFLESLEENFRTIIVQSATLPIEFVKNWLIKYHLDQYVDYVTNHKPPAAVYVDDRAVTHTGNFKETLEKVRSFKPFWESLDTGI